MTAAYACAAVAALGCDLAAGDSDLAGASALTAAYACAVVAARGCDRAAAYRNIRDYFFCCSWILTAATDARAAETALGIEAAFGIIRVSDGQIAAIILLHASVVSAAFDLVSVIQLDGHVAITLGGHSGFSKITSTHVDVHVFQRDIRGCATFSFYGDGIGCLLSITCNNNILIVFCSGSALRNIMSVFGRAYLNAAICKVIFLRKCRDRQTCDEKQSHCH